MLRVSPDALFAYAKTVEGQELQTATGKVFTVKAQGDSLVFTPKSTGKPRAHDRKFMQKVCDAYSRTNSLKPGDYREVTYNASYTLVLIGHFAESVKTPRKIPATSSGTKTASDVPLPLHLPETVLRAIKQRRGQPEFRAKLTEAYGGRCAITGCDAVPALEASHIVGYAETGSQDVTNGLLLRADIHTLFDCDLIRIDPTSMSVVLTDGLKGTAYDELDGKPLRSPRNPGDAPSTPALRKRWEKSQPHSA